MTAKAMRAQFEAWVTKQSWFAACLGLTMIHDAYIDPCVNSRWQGYQAALRSPVAAGLVEAQRTIKHSIQQARIPGNDWKRELVLIENAVDAALANFTGDKP